MLMSYLHSLPYYRSTDHMKYISLCTKLKNQIKTSPNTFNIPMKWLQDVTTSMNHPLKDRSSESVENLNLEAQRLITLCTDIQLSETMACVVWNSFLGIYPGILILISVSTSMKTEIINQECLHTFANALAIGPLPAKGFVLRKERPRKAEEPRDSAEHRIQRTVDLNDHHCVDFLLIKICFRRIKANTLASWLTHGKRICLYL